MRSQDFEDGLRDVNSIGRIRVNANDIRSNRYVGAGNALGKSFFIGAQASGGGILRIYRLMFSGNDETPVLIIIKISVELRAKLEAACGVNFFV